MKCPKCGTYNAPAAKDCKDCGTVFAELRKELDDNARFCQCSHTDCTTPAICRIKTPTGWANMCQQHYDDWHLNLARDYCTWRGLDSRAKQRDYIKTTLKNSSWAIAAELTAQPRHREPGDDDEPMTT